MLIFTYLPTNAIVEKIIFGVGGFSKIHNFFSKRTFVQWLSKIHFIQFTTQENLQFTWEPLPTRECVWDTGISKEMVGQALFDENNQAPTTTLLIGVN